MICAAENGHESAVRLLLEKGADLDLTILILVSQLSNLQNALWNHVEGQKDRPHIFAGPYYWDKQSQVPCFASQNLQLQRAQPVPEYTPESVQCPQGCFLYGLPSGAIISITSRPGWQSTLDIEWTSYMTSFNASQNFHSIFCTVWGTRTFAIKHKTTKQLPYMRAKKLDTWPKGIRQRIAEEAQPDLEQDLTGIINLEINLPQSRLYNGVGSRLLRANSNS